MRLRSLTRETRNAQTTVEFALVMLVGAMVLFVSIQLALIGEAYLSLGQVADQGVRYAAVHWDCNLTSCAGGEQSIKSYMLSIGSPTLTVNGGSYLNISASPAAPRTRGQTVTVSATYTLPPTLLFLPNPFMGIPFPRTLTDSKSAYSEGN